MSNFFRPFVIFLFHIGYFGPFVLGILDSSFLVLPFGNDLLVVGLIARHHGGFAWYVLSAAIGSTVGVLLLALIARKFGEEGIRKVAGEKRFQKLHKQIGTRSGLAIAFACLAPPPFPFTMVIAAASALDYSLWRMAAINFICRGIRFTILGFLALKFGMAFLRIAHTPAFIWSMIGFIAACLLATAFSIWHWVRSSRSDAKASA